MKPFEYQRADSVEDACRQIGDAAPAYAGGTDLLTLVKGGLRTPERVVDVKRTGLSADIVDEGGRVTLGALVTLAAIERSALLREHLAALPTAASEAATPQLRNRATIAGNLLQRPRCWYYRTPEVDCWLKGGCDCPARTGRNEHHAIFTDSPCVAVHPSDLAGPLVALDATVHLRDAAGTRTLRVAELLAPPEEARRTEHVLGPGELITGIEIDTTQRIVSTYRKAMDRATWAFALAGVAVAARVDGDRLLDTRVVLSGVANTPRRAGECETVLTAAGALDAPTIERAAAAAATGAEPLSENGYKRQLVTALTRDALTEIARAIR